ncbi:Hsp70 family protein [Sporomusa acidovorans]|uniref:Chaperone protein DnaK n=1 Tax=Sporomusa acidovorans (strain ATCC 49682 / DSM 3132 / Mol) TaxID=1123286 RepID=A0ABZ3IYV3_SPOA4|nr:Hsp70 family protein [Sporomusa acidovorans]OZC22192.1 chaperone protein DnaK [Sporomusa acidovorans DSM 3132]SDE81834.1 molecular chaperone DnaK [Sporomusa acidovorans]
MINKTRPVVGIDLGTTNSAVAYIAKGKPAIIPSPQGQRIIPSVVMLDLQGKILVGDAARAAQVAMPDRVVAAVKRKMGSNEPVVMAGQAFSPQEISAMILKELKSFVDSALGEGEKEAVITVPAYFTDEQRRATKQAGELAGFVVERIVNEPTAAALAFGLERLEEDKHILVYDLGGGTFDVSVVEMMSGILEVKASAGNNHLGGEDFDWLLVNWLAGKIKKSHGIDPLNDMRAKSLLKEQAEKIKIELSSAEKTAIHLPLVVMKNNRPVGLSTEITRQDFVGLIENLLTETVECVRRAMADAKVEVSEIQEILLVGGSTRIPRVRELLTAFFGKEPRCDVNPDEAVALGAAVQAGLKSGELSDSGLIITDVAPFSLGTSILDEHRGMTRDGVFSVIIPRNTTIPVTRTERFYTATPGQTSVQVDIYQGEHELVKYNHSLGEFLLEGIPANYRKVEPIDITYRYNLNGILEVTAKCVSNGREESLTVQDALARDSEQQFAASVDKLQALYENAPKEEPDMDSEYYLPDFADDEDGDGAATASLEELREELGMLQNRLAAIKQESNELTRKKLGKLEHRLDEAKLLEDTADIQKIIDEATDVLIDLEMEAEE